MEKREENPQKKEKRMGKYRRKYFIYHNFKSMGTTLVSFMPELAEYRKMVYCRKTREEYERDSGIRLKEPFATTVFNETFKNKVSIDHLHIDTLYELGILDDWNLENTESIFIFRNPIERFYSMANTLNKNAKELLELILNKKNKFVNYVNFQNAFVQNSRNWKIDIIDFNRKDLITEWFEKRGITINLTKRHNHKSKEGKVETKLKNQDKATLLNIYEKDIEIYRSLEDSGTIKCSEM